MMIGDDDSIVLLYETVELTDVVDKCFLDLSRTTLFNSVSPRHSTDSQKALDPFSLFAIVASSRCPGALRRHCSEG